MQILYQLLPLVLLFAVIYFLMIRPQRKKDKQIQDMRKSLQVGDEIVTIGGIGGKIVKTKDESFIIQVGADKVKFEMMRWAVSSVTKASPRRDTVDEVKEEEPKKELTPEEKEAKKSELEATIKDLEVKLDEQVKLENFDECDVINTQIENLKAELKQYE